MKKSFPKSCSLTLHEQHYLDLSFQAHLFHVQYNSSSIPSSITIPWIESSNALGCLPVISYLSTVLLNIKDLGYELVDEHGNEKAINDASFTFTQRHRPLIRMSFTETPDETWFYLVSARIEAYWDHLVDLGIQFINSTENNKKAFYVQLTDLIEQKFIPILRSMYKHCKRTVFYSQIRPFLTGWTDNDRYGKSGMCYELQNEQKQTYKLFGASAAQSPTVRLLDVLLGIDYGGADNYLIEMRRYMLKEHREMIEEFEMKMRAHKMIYQDSKERIKAIDAFRHFRDVHLIIVKYYIGHEGIGTGGTDAIPMLIQIRDHTCEKIE